MTQKKKAVRGKFYKKGMKIEFAEAKTIKAAHANVDRLLLMIGEYMGWEGDISHVWVSDESMLWDFNLEDSEISDLSQKLGFEVTGKSYIHEIALRMKPTN